MSTQLAKHASQPLGGRLLRGLPEAKPLDRLRTILEAFLAHLALRRAEAQLASLNDHTLKDIGMTRGEIGYLLREAAKERRQSRAKSLGPQSQGLSHNQ